MLSPRMTLFLYSGSTLLGFPLLVFFRGVLNVLVCLTMRISESFFAVSESIMPVMLFGISSAFSIFLIASDQMSEYAVPIGFIMCFFPPQSFRCLPHAVQDL